MELNKVVSDCTFKMMEAGHTGIMKDDILYINANKAEAIFRALMQEINRMQESLPANK